MMKHQHAELIKAWADNTDIRFSNGNDFNLTGDIHDVMNHPDHNWQIVKEPVVEVRCYRKRVSVNYESGGGAPDIAYFPTIGKESWNMRITITDGDMKNAKVELR